MTDTHPDAIIELLGMQPHPEGGHFVETFRDAREEGERGHSTAIYYLLREGERSHWHRVKDAAETWHWYAGGPMKLGIAPLNGPAHIHLLGQNLSAGERPQIVVPRGHWQSAEPLGRWTLVGCTVAPGFDFAAFELAPEGWSPR